MNIPNQWPDELAKMGKSRWRYLRQVLPTPVEWVADYNKLTPLAMQMRYEITSNDYALIRAFLGLELKRKPKPPEPAPVPEAPHQASMILDQDALALAIADLVVQNLAPAVADLVVQRISPMLRLYDQVVLADDKRRNGQ